VGNNPSGTITIPAFASSDTADTSIDSASSTYADEYIAYNTDVFKLTINGKSVTTSVAFDTDEAYTSTLAIIDGPLMNALSNRWNAVYGNAAAASYSESLFVTSENSAVLTITAKTGSGRRGYDKSYSVSKMTQAGKSANVSTTLAFFYGDTTASSDNKTASDDIVITIESNVAGTVLDEAHGVSIVGMGLAAVTKLTTTLNTNVDLRTSTLKDIFPLEARGDGAAGVGGDAVLPEGAVDEVATPAVSFSRVHWLN